MTQMLVTKYLNDANVAYKVP